MHLAPPPLAPLGSASSLLVEPMVDPLADYRLQTEPYYDAQGGELALFEAAYAQRMPVMLKGPTGCGKTRFVEHMAWRLGRPLITVACNDDLSANDLIGRWLLDADGTRWQDGPLTLAARHGAICYLDELVEARADTTVVIHPLTDTRRMLPLTACNEVVHAHSDFALVVSYNPGPMAREMKSSTRQRFAALEFGYPAPEREAGIVATESGLDLAEAAPLVAFGVRTRRLQGHGLDAGASTRTLRAWCARAWGASMPAAWRSCSRSATTLACSRRWRRRSTRRSEAMAAELPLHLGPPPPASTRHTGTVTPVAGALVAVQRYLRALWAIAPTLQFDAEWPHIVGTCLHLPPLAPAADGEPKRSADWITLCAAAAHASAHLVYSPPVFESRGLRPLVRALVGVLEDARVEALACRELPGLRRLWASQHRVQPHDGDDVETLLLRLARTLADPDHVDPHPWVQKGRRLFYLDADVAVDACQVLALHQHAALRQAASLLGNDLGQMRLQFNGRLYRPGPAYRDDNRWMWPRNSDALTEPVMPPPPPPPDPHAGSAEAPDDVRVESPIAPVRHHPEWDRLIEQLRPQWCAVHDQRVEPGWAEVASGAATLATQATQTTWHGAGPASMTSGALAVHPQRQPVRQALRQVAAPPDRRGQVAADGSHFDLDALLRARIHQRLRVAADGRVHRRAQPGRHAGAALVLIDQSASSVDRWDGSVSHSGAQPASLLQAACESAALAVDALQAMGIATALCGFRSDGRHRVHLNEVLGFGEALDDVALARLASLRSGGSTRLGAVLRHATHRMRSPARAQGGAGLAPEAPRWVLLISDGQPHDIDVHDPHYLVADARMAVRQAAQQRVAVSCLALLAQPRQPAEATGVAGLARVGDVRVETGSAPGPARRIFGLRHVAVLDRMAVLPQRLRRLLAAAQR